MSTERVPMTVQGHARLEERLRTLKNEERPAVIKAIAEAREHGDLSENAEYHAAREKQGFIESEITNLESQLGRAEVIDPADMAGDSIKFGATIDLVDEDTEEEVTYQIVGTPESDLAAGRLSVAAPLARALIGKSVGDSVEVNTPKGAKYYEVEAVRWV